MTCPACGASNVDNARFCQRCGRAFDPPRPAEGERKWVTVLFADVADSTAMAERLDPEQFAEIMNGAFSFMSAAVAKYGGTVARLMGDAVLALFGAPVTWEDHAERAVRAGLMMRAHARDYAHTVESQMDRAFQVRIGINTGLVVAGEVGTEWRTEYTAMGDATNVAARLQTLARPGAVLVSGSTHRLVSSLFRFTPLGEVSLKGKSAPMEAFEVLEPRLLANQARGVEGMHSPLVGREAELARLASHVSTLGLGKGSLVALLGEAGIGKSRLVAEAQAGQPSRPLRWVECRCLSYTQSTAYAPWRQIIRELLGVREDDPVEEVRQLLHTEWTRLGASGEDLPYLATLLGVEREGSLEEAKGLEGEVLVRRITESVRNLLQAVTAEAPTVLVFDDLHWADAASLELITGISHLTLSCPLLLVCSLRPERQSPSSGFLETLRNRHDGTGPYTEIVLDSLSKGHSLRLLSNLLQVQGLSDAGRDLILQKSEGNPFFLEEILRSLVDSGHIVRENAHWRATREIAAVTVPDTLMGVLSARIDGLPEDTKRVAQTAAVIGRSFSRRLLRAVCASSPPTERVAELDSHLETLTAEDLIRERARHPEVEYTFKHALTQQAAYDLLLVRRRRDLHRRTAEVLEALHPERSPEVSPILAHHYFLGEAWQPAIEHSRKAGEEAVRLYALKEAYGHYSHAVEAAERRVEEDPRQLIDVALDWTFVVYALRLHETGSDRERVMLRLRHAEDLARDLADAPRLGRILVWQGNLHMLAGYPTESFQKLREGYEIAVEIGDEGLALLPLFAMTWFLVDIDPRAALPRLEKVIADARTYSGQPGSKELEAHAHAVLGLAHARLGEFAHAERAIQEALELAPHTRSPIKEADIDLAVAMVYYEMGDIEKGLRYSRSGTEHAMSVRGMECACTGTFLLGLGNLHMQRIEEALEAFEASHAMAASLGTGMQSEKLRIQASLAFARLKAGEARALEELEAGLGKARALRDEYSAAFVSQMLGEAHAELGDVTRADTHYRDALEYYRGKGMIPSVDRVLGSLAELHDLKTSGEEEGHHLPHQ